MSTGMSNEVLINCVGSPSPRGRRFGRSLPAWPLATQAVNPRSDGSLSADDLVHEALAAEVDGRSQDRDRWAQAALKDSPTLPSALAGWAGAGQPGPGSRSSRPWTSLTTGITSSTCSSGSPTATRPRTSMNLASGARSGGSRSRPVPISCGSSNSIPTTPPRSRLGYKQFGGQWHTTAELQQAESQKRNQSDMAKW